LLCLLLTQSCIPSCSFCKFCCTTWAIWSLFFTV